MQLGLSLLFLLSTQCLLAAQQLAAGYQIPIHADGDGACGPRALYVTCRLYGLDTSIQELSDLSRGAEDGTTSMADLRNAAIEMGLHAVGARLSLEDLRLAGFPAIALLKINDSSHFVLVLADSKGIRICDPAISISPIRADPKKFKKVWTGEVLFVSNGTISYTNRSRVRIHLWIFLACLGTALLCVPILIKRATNNAHKSRAS